MIQQLKRKIQQGKKLGSLPRREIWIFAILYAISRVVSLFIPGMFQDFYEHAIWGDALFHSIDIYNYIPIGATEAELKYLPLFYPHLSLLYLLFGFFSWSFRIGVTIWDFVVVLVLFYFSGAMHQSNDEQKTGPNKNKLSVLYIYAFSPLTILNLIFGTVWFLGAMYMILGLFAFYLNKSACAGVFFCLGFLTEIFPVFCLIPILLYHLTQKKWKDLGRFIGSFGVTFILGCLPFYLVDPANFVVNFTLHLTRTPLSLSIWRFMTLDPISILGLIDISWSTILLLGVIVAFTVYCLLYYRKQAKIDEKSVLTMIILLFLVLPFAFLSVETRFYYWIFPLLCVLMINKINLKTTKDLAIISTAVTVIIGTTFLILFPSSLLVDQRNPSNWQATSTFLDPMLGLFAVTTPLFFIPWFLNGRSLYLAALPLKKLDFHRATTIFSGIVLIQFAAIGIFASKFLAYSLFTIITIGVGLLINGRLLIAIKNTRKQLNNLLEIT